MIVKTFVRYQSALKRFVSRFLLGAGHDIDDIVQETFLRAYEAEKKTSIAEPKAFLFRIAKNLILSEFDKKSYKITDYIEDCEPADFAVEGMSVEDDVAAQKKLGMFCEAVASLPFQCRRVYVMKRVYGFSQKEIASQLGISESTVEKHIIKGMRRCSRLLDERYDYRPKQSQSPNEANAGNGESRKVSVEENHCVR